MSAKSCVCSRPSGRLAVPLAVILFVPTFLAAIYVLRRCELTDRIETRVTALHGHVTRDVDLADACGRTGPTSARPGAGMSSAAGLPEGSLT